MKTETQTARFYIKNKFKENPLGLLHCHKATCQRWLEFLAYNYKVMKKICKEYFRFKDKVVEKKITDLKQAIKTYEDVGI